MINVTKTNCCGCGACAAICPKDAIAMVPDLDGFVYPVVDDKKCIHCNMCERVCSYRNSCPEISEKEVWAAVSTTTDLKESASGGIFSALSKTILSEGGYVYGSAMVCENSKLKARHIEIDNEIQLIKLKGSKYLKSDTTDIYPKVKKRLQDGNLVLFSGTPCQAAALKGYLNKDYENLYIVEIICHGVPSLKFFQDYIEFEENKRGKKITSFRFRDKSDGWKLHGAMTFESGETEYFEPEESSYYQMFLNSYIYRENCYSCPYACEKRAGDVTIGDYWCIDIVHPELLTQNGGELSEEKGISALIINNPKGRELVNRFGSGIKRYKSSYENAAKYNAQLKKPSALKEERAEVLALYKEGYDKVEKWYRKRLRPIKFKRKIRALIPKPVKNIIKKFIGK